MMQLPFAKLRANVPVVFRLKASKFGGIESSSLRSCGDRTSPGQGVYVGA